MLAKKTDDRYQSMDEVLRDLEPLWKTAQHATVAGLVADSQQLFAANDLQRAQALLRKALQIDVGNTQAKSLMEKVTVELRRSLLLPKITEHLDRGRGFLRTGKLREARGEADAALGLDSRHESAQSLLAEVEAAAARAQEVEQKLRLAKQRLAGRSAHGGSHRSRTSARIGQRQRARPGTAAADRRRPEPPREAQETERNIASGENPVDGIELRRVPESSFRGAPGVPG